ncbi:MAG: diphosphokinase / guanosine-3,5-bis(diphosphate) 3-diphosphatase [Candidatus Sumerlaeota bacterium]|nr:diphosphokinase / guanosine-3,5-bis(diphosphate) 3-diphosphatase [Candidatus Sumerlaeota bacterium]
MCLHSEWTAASSALSHSALLPCPPAEATGLALGLDRVWLDYANILALRALFFIPHGIVPTMSVEAEQSQSIDRQFEELLERLPAEPEARELVRHAYEVAKRFHSDQVRKSGEAYLEHPIAVANLLVDLNMDVWSVAAGLLHDVLEDTTLTGDELASLFPAPVPALVQGVTKIGRIHFDTSREHQIENLRKIILAMAKDIRVLIIKLCDRLHNMRTLRPLAPERRIAISRETIDIYAPLANRLGMVRMKSELEDLAMHWLYPEEYQALSNALAKKRKVREQEVLESIEVLKTRLAKFGHENIEISGRSKHFYSIFRKMRDTGQSFDEIYDLNAVRVFCDTEAQCYEILGQIHSFWTPVPGRIRDYIGMPKPNMYQSLHTTVIGYNGMVTEIQIRTHEMHRVAEYGIAAHWKYKEGRLDQSVDRRLQWLRQVTEWITEVGDANSLLDALRKDVFADVVLCFTPKGDVIELPAEATPIDFAFAIHTKVGERCVGARINRRMATLRSRLKHGDVVEILTSNSGHPSRDWLDVAATGRAKSKIKHWLKSKEMETWVADGWSALWRVLKERNIEVTKSELETYLEKLKEPFRLQAVEDVLAEIGFGSISPQAALTRMNPEWSRARRLAKKKSKARRQEELVSIEGMEDLQVRIANCCKPIPGDPIVGFVTRGRGITVHSRRCPSVARMQADPEDAPRLLPARWNVSEPIVSNVFLRIEAYDRNDLLMEITQEFSRQNIFILQCQTRSDKRKNIAVIRMEADVSDLRQVDNVLEGIRNVSGVVRAGRTNRFLA